MAKIIKIEKINYFGNDETKSNNWNAKVLYTRNGKMHKQLNMVIENVIADIIFLYPDISYEEAELTTATMIQYPNLLIELDIMVKDKEKTNDTRDPV